MEWSGIEMGLSGERLAITRRGLDILDTDTDTFAAKLFCHDR
jgi:hypothetical protein